MYYTAFATWGPLPTEIRSISQQRGLARSLVGYEQLTGTVVASICCSILLDPGSSTADLMFREGQFTATLPGTLGTKCNEIPIAQALKCLAIDFSLVMSKVKDCDIKCLAEPGCTLELLLLGGSAYPDSINKSASRPCHVFGRFEQLTEV